jgi:hypothetical protein
MPPATTSVQYRGRTLGGQARPRVIHRADGVEPRPAWPNGLYRAFAGFAYRPSRPWRATPPVWVAVQDPHDGGRAGAADLLNACDAQPGYSGFIPTPSRLPPQPPAASGVSNLPPQRRRSVPIANEDRLVVPDTLGTPGRDHNEARLERACSRGLSRVRSTGSAARPYIRPAADSRASPPRSAPEDSRSPGSQRRSKQVADSARLAGVSITAVSVRRLSSYGLGRVGRGGQVGLSGEPIPRPSGWPDGRPPGPRCRLKIFNGESYIQGRNRVRCWRGSRR